jgi:nucleoid-associated protein YgaU
MRKDVKLGLSIGGVLLACLIVYILVPKNNEGAQFARQGEPGNSADPHQDAPTAGAGGSAASPSAPSSPHPDTPAGQPASSAPSHDAIATGPGADTSAGSDPTTTTGTGAGAGSGESGTDVAATTPRSYDWERILITGEVPKTPLAAIGGNRGPSDERNPANDVFGDGQKPGASSNDINWKGQAGTTGGTSTGTQKHGQPPAGQQQVVTGGTRSTPREHVVQQGEHLSSIALQVYGDARLYKEILKANPGLDERKLKPGTTLKIPDPSTFATAARTQQPAAKQEPAIDSAKEYRVAPGDSLHKIAVKLYGKPAKADDLYELNKDKIGDDSSRVKVGMVLKLPEAPTASAAPSAR